MRVCVTCASDSIEIDRIYSYCQRNGIIMRPSSYIHVAGSYWVWRIESEPCAALTWLLLQYPDLLCVY